VYGFVPPRAVRRKRTCVSTFIGFTFAGRSVIVGP
jgi:hypothetical protein